MVAVSRVPVSQGAPELTGDDQEVKCSGYREESSFQEERSELMQNTVEVLSRWKYTWMVQGQAPGNIWQAAAHGD